MIRLNEITKRYGQMEILRGVTLEVASGEVCVLLGPSGGGKSTLLRTINGLETFDGGAIEVAGLKLLPGTGVERDRTLHEIRKRVGMVFQQFNLFPHRTVLENVIEAPVHVLRQSKEEAIQRARGLLDRVGLLEKAHTRPASLSGGQQWIPKRFCSMNRPAPLIRGPQRK